MVLAGVGAWFGLSRSFPEVDPPPVPEAMRVLVDLAGISSQSTQPLVAAWNKGRGVPLGLRRDVEGWVEFQGVPHAVVVYRRDHKRRRDVFCTEFLQVQADAIACSRRVVGSATFDLVPPQPVLKLPLTPGTRWSWEGHVGAQAARAEFVVRPADPELPTRIEVEQVTTLLGEAASEAMQSSRVVVYGLGVGFAEESGQFPVGEAGMPVDWLESKIATVDSSK